MSLATNRRTLIGALTLPPIAFAAAPIVAAVPATAAPLANRHGDWLIEQAALFDLTNERGLSDEECNRRVDRCCIVEERIFDTPAQNSDEAIAKLEMVRRLYEESYSVLPEEQVYGIVSECARILFRSTDVRRIAVRA